MPERRELRQVSHGWVGAEPVLDLERERALVSAAAAGDVEARDQLVRSHMRLVRKIASRHRRSGIALEDLVSEGAVGLLEALERFDPLRGGRFAGYAAWWIRARVARFALANRRLVGLPATRNARFVLRDGARIERSLAQRLARTPSQDELARALGIPVEELAAVRSALHSPDVSLEQPTCADEAATPEQEVLERQAHLRLQSQVQAALDNLTLRERTLVSEQYLDDDGRSLSQLGEAFGVSRQRLGQVLHSARNKLRLELAHAV